MNGEAGPEPPRRDKRRYFILMGVCVALFVLSWAVVERYSVLAAVIMSAVALVIPPLAAIVANRRGPDDYWWDEPNDEWLKDEPKDDSWRRDEQEAMERADRSSRHPHRDDGEDDAA
jgi:Protein of unknown function (DUF3099)